MLPRKSVQTKIVRVIETELAIVLAVLVLLGMALGYAIATAATTRNPATSTQQPSQIAPSSLDGGEEDFVF